NDTPAPQTVNVFVGSNDPIGYQSSASTTDGGLWLSVSPTTGSTSATSPGRGSVSVNPAGLKPGIYTGQVSYAFAGSAVRSVNVTLVVKTLSSGSPTSANSTKDISSTNCTPAQIVPIQTALVSNFAAPAAWPAELAIQLSTDCGAPVSNGQVVALFSNG